MASYESTTRMEIVQTNLSTSNLSGSNETTLTLGVGNIPSEGMLAFVSRQIVINNPSSDQTAAFVTGAKVDVAETISISADTSASAPVSSSSGS